MTSDEWQLMSTAPRDGTRMDVLAEGPYGGEPIVVRGLFFGEAQMGDRKRRVLRGDQYPLSGYLTAIGWRKA